MAGRHYMPWFDTPGRITVNGKSESRQVLDYHMEPVLVAYDRINDRIFLDNYGVKDSYKMAIKMRHKG